jgi:hypothetical protein
MGVVVLMGSRHHAGGRVSVFWTSQEEERKYVSMSP